MRLFAFDVAVILAAAVLSGCAALSGLSELARGACEGPCEDATPDASSQSAAGIARDAGAAVVTSTSDAEPAPDPNDFCGGAVCDSPATCCGPRDGGALKCARDCPALDVLVACVDDGQCPGSVCCGEYYDEWRAIGGMTCSPVGAKCAYPLCSTEDGGAGVCPTGMVCRRLSAMLPEVCTIP